MQARTILVAVAAVLLAAGAAQADVFNMGGTRDPATGVWTGLASLEMVHVGDPGNTGDVAGAGASGIYGAVSYQYNIGKYDVTAGQYTEFLNAVAKTDTYGLYRAYMSNTKYGACGITQDGSVGSYTYSVASDRANKPVTSVSFWDACRFANWLNNGRPTGAEGSGTTETGAYTLNGYNGVDGGTIQRNSSATWAVTSLNEWYKAAYYDPTLNGGSGGYWAFPTQSNTISTAMANYGRVVEDTTDVGSYPYPSYYGTFDQCGNVWQWNEKILSDSRRGQRGGAFDEEDERYMQPGSQYGVEPRLEYVEFGFRVVQVPEPATLSLLALGGLAMIRRRRH